jgi:hypothetical protein
VSAITPLVASADVNPDVNHDGKVTYIDMLLTKKSTLGMYSGNYDANGDGTTNVLDLELVKNYFLYGYEVTTTTQAPTTEVSYAQTLTDGHGNTYPSEGYARNYANGVVYKAGSDGYIIAQNYAAAVEEYYGISMIVEGTSVYPSCLENFDVTGSLDELNAWREGRTPAEIGVTEIVNHWSLICNDGDFWTECEVYFESLDLLRSFSTGAGYSV